jgi:hypothetical protein
MTSGRAPARCRANLVLLASGGVIDIGTLVLRRGRCGGHALSNGTRVARAAAARLAAGSRHRRQCLATTPPVMAATTQANAVLDIAGSANGNLPAVLIGAPGALDVRPM